MQKVYYILVHNMHGAKIKQRDLIKSMMAGPDNVNKLITPTQDDVETEKFAENFKNSKKIT